MIRIGILGGAGYTAGELIRLLVHHPEASLQWVHSESHAGHRVDAVHEGLLGDTDLTFVDECDFDGVDVLFFCFGHGKSEAFMREHPIPARVRIIDLAQDFRLSPTDGNTAIALQDADAVAQPSPAHHDFVYGLPELHRSVIARAHRVANPGCFATCLQLGLLPAASLGLVADVVSVNAITGSTGAGVKPGATTHFSWRTGNMSIYKAFRHQHIPEVRQSLQEVQQAAVGDIDFLPYRGDFARGIFATMVIRLPREADEETILARYATYYAAEPFTHYSTAAIDLKQVVNTNKAVVHAEIIDRKLLVTAAIDNLLKGAVGQAVQNMNIMMGLPEQLGLQLKASAF